MKALRRSMKGEKAEPGRPPHMSLTPKTDMFVAPPEKVIEATRPYRHGVTQPGVEIENHNAQFLSFEAGDFLYVTGKVTDNTHWYDAWRSDRGAVERGLVPRSFFKDVGKTRSSTGSVPSAMNTPALPDSGYSTATSHARTPSGMTPRTPKHVRTSSMARGAMVYGVVQYDFSAERPDELEAKAGEAIIVIAQSNPEWFVAKPIGRLGGPGLIPVSFIEIKDMATGDAVDDPHKAVQAAGVPKVEEWKKLAADYKNSSISLGQFTIPTPNTANNLTQGMEQMSLNGGQRPPQNGYQYQPGHPPQQQQPPAAQRQLTAPVSASIPRYCFENDKYWYIIECVMEDGSHWELSRFYQNFYDFQIKLLQQFPVEAAAEGGTRILPYMPGPVTYVTDAISNGRRESLDEYVKRLLKLPPYISRCQLVRELFEPREGDFELDPRAMQEDYRLSSGSQQYSSMQNSQNLSREPSSNQLDSNPYAAQAQSNPWQGQQDSYQYSNYDNQSSQSVSATGYGNYNDSNTQLAEAPSAPTSRKIKIWWGEDCIAIRIPEVISLRELKDRLHERLEVSGPLTIEYKDEGSEEMQLVKTDEILKDALDSNPRLHLYVG